mgnify:CR=1 FL=1|jgi:hypothetical protein
MTAPQTEAAAALSARIEELERLVGVTMAVAAQEAKG